MTAWSQPLASQCPTYHRIKCSCSWVWLQGEKKNRFPFKIDLFFLRPLVRGLFQLLEGGPSCNNAHFLITRQACNAIEIHVWSWACAKVFIRSGLKLGLKVDPFFGTSFTTGYLVHLSNRCWHHWLLFEFSQLNLSGLCSCSVCRRLKRNLFHKKYCWSKEMCSYCCLRQHHVS